MSSNVNMVVNVDSDGGTAVPSLGGLQVRVKYVDANRPDGFYKPLTIESAEKVVAVLAARTEIDSVTIETISA